MSKDSDIAALAALVKGHSLMIEALLEIITHTNERLENIEHNSDVLKEALDRVAEILRVDGESFEQILGRLDKLEK